MQRFNSFTLIHKALRAMLYDAALTVQQTYFADSNEAETAFEKVETVLHSFDNHAHHEDSHVLPAVELYNKQLVDEFESEHIKDLQLSNSLRNLLNIYRHLNFSEERIACGSAIAKAFVEFMVFNLEHMAKEELKLLPVLWENYTDAQLMAINQKIIANIPQQEMMTSATWMMRGINNSDAIKWMKGVKATAPDFMFQALVATAERELTPSRFATIMSIVEEPVMAV
jgi:hypothetical protein